MQYLSQFHCSLFESLPGEPFMFETGLLWLYSRCPGEIHGNFCTRAQNTPLHLACTSALDNSVGQMFYALYIHVTVHRKRFLFK